MGIKNKSNRSYRITMILLLVLIGFSLAYGAFTFSQSNWQDTQTHVYEGGIGQIRDAGEFVIDSSSCGGTGTIYDSITNLCWEQAPSTSTMNWTSAVPRCSGLVLAGGNWRLPEKAELMSLLHHNGPSATYNRLNSVIGFSGIKNSYYYSNTKYSLLPSTKVYAVDFYDALSYYYFMTNDFYVLCVKTAS